MNKIRLMNLQCKSVFMVILIVLLPIGQALTQVFEGDQGIPARLRVGILPIKDLTPASLNLFSKIEADLPSEKIASEYHQRIVDLVKSEYYVDVVDLNPAIKELTAGDRYQKNIKVAEGFYNLGKDAYKDLNTDSAVKHLNQSKKEYQNLYYSVIMPEYLADLCLTLALSYLEKGDTGLGIEHLKLVFELDPKKRLRKGYYAPQIEETIKNAQEAFWLTPDFDNPLRDLDTLHGFVKELGLDVLVYSYLRQTESGYLLRLLVYSRKKNEFEIRETIKIDKNAPLDASVGGSIERLQRAMSRWIACANFEMKKPLKKSYKKFYIDTSFVYEIYAKHVTREPFHNFGVDVSFAYQVKDTFDIFGTIGLFMSMKDPNNDLFVSFKSIRLIIGAGYTYIRHRWRIYVNPGIDFRYLGNFKISTNPFCKWDVQSMCPPSNISTLDLRFLLGINLAVGFQVEVHKNIYFNFKTAISGYFIPLDQDTPLNLPFDAEAGLGFKF